MEARPSRKMPSSKRIYEHWRSTSFAKLPEVGRLFAEWQMMGDGSRNYWDVCWSCADDERGVERAHLLARVYGGLDNEANLILLCRLCHKDQPDFGVDTAIAWLNRRAFLANEGVWLFGTLPLLLRSTASELTSQNHEWALRSNAAYSAEWNTKTEIERVAALREMHAFHTKALAQLAEKQAEYDQRKAS